MCLDTVYIGSQQAVPPLQLHIPMPLAAVAWRGLAAPPVSLSQCLLRLLTAPSPLCALAAGRSGGALLLPLSALVALKHMHSSLIRFVLEPSCAVEC